MDISEQIKKAREEKGYTQKELGEIAHMSASLIGHYETGFRHPGKDAVRVLEEALGTSFERKKTSDMEQISIQSLEELQEKVEIIVDEVAGGFGAAHRQLLYLTILLCIAFDGYVSNEQGEKITREKIAGDLEFLLFTSEGSGEDGLGIRSFIREMVCAIEKKLVSDANKSSDAKLGELGCRAGKRLLAILPREEDSFVTEFKILLSCAAR